MQAAGLGSVLSDDAAVLRKERRRCFQFKGFMIIQIPLALGMDGKKFTFFLDMKISRNFVRIMKNFIEVLNQH